MYVSEQEKCAHLNYVLKFWHDFVFSWVSRTRWGISTSVLDICAFYKLHITNATLFSHLCEIELLTRILILQHRQRRCSVCKWSHVCSHWVPFGWRQHSNLAQTVSKVCFKLVGIKQTKWMLSKKSPSKTTCASAFYHHMSTHSKKVGFDTFASNI